MTVPINSATGLSRLIRQRFPPRRQTPRTQQPPIPMRQTVGFGHAEGYVPDREAFDCQNWPNRPECGFRGDRPWGNFDTVDSLSSTFTGSDQCRGWSCVRLPYGQGYRISCLYWQFRICDEEFVPARHGFTGIFPGGQSNRSDVGWVQNCQYFVHLALQDGSSWQLNQEPSWLPNASAWDPDQQNGWIWPAYGPIERLEWEPRIGPNGDITGWRYYLVCNGLGLYGVGGPNPTNSRLVSFPDSEMTVNRWIYNAYYNVRLARPFRGTQNPFHEDIWLYRPGQDFTNTLQPIFVGTERPLRRFLFTLGSPNLRIYRIFQASDVSAHVYPPSGQYPTGGLDFAAGQTATYGEPCFRPPVPPPLPPIPRFPEEPDMGCCSCNEIETIIRRRLRPLMQFLELSENAQQQTITLNPESLIESAGNVVYGADPPQGTTARTLKELLATISAALYYRAGYHRLPAEVPNLTDENNDNQPTIIEDAMSWQVWLVQELDAVLGKFPLQIKTEVEERDDEGNLVTVTREAKVPNLAEALIEMIGVLLRIAADADDAADFAMRGMIEAGKAEIAALIAQDYAKANAQFLGYKGNPVIRTVKFPYNPGTPDIPDDPNAPQTPEGGNR